MLLEILGRLEVFVRANLRRLQRLKHLSWLFQNRLGKLLQELDVIVIQLVASCLAFLRGEVNLELKK